MGVLGGHPLTEGNKWAKIGGTIFGVPIAGMIVFWGLYWGPPIYGNYQVFLWLHRELQALGRGRGSFLTAAGTSRICAQAVRSGSPASLPAGSQNTVYVHDELLPKVAQ